MFSDLECDYINPIDLCNKLNQVRHTYPLTASMTNLPLSTVCTTRACRAWVPHTTVPTVRAVDSVPHQCTITRIQHQQVRLEPPSLHGGLTRS